MFDTIFLFLYMGYIVRVIFCYDMKQVVVAKFLKDYDKRAELTRIFDGLNTTFLFLFYMEYILRAIFCYSFKDMFNFLF